MFLLMQYDVMVLIIGVSSLKTDTVMVLLSCETEEICVDPT